MGVDKGIGVRPPTVTRNYNENPELVYVQNWPTVYNPLPPAPAPGEDAGQPYVPYSAPSADFAVPVAPAPQAPKPTTPQAVSAPNLTPAIRDFTRALRDWSITLGNAVGSAAVPGYKPDVSGMLSGAEQRELGQRQARAKSYSTQMGLVPTATPAARENPEVATARNMAARGVTPTQAAPTQATPTQTAPTGTAPYRDAQGRVMHPPQVPGDVAVPAAAIQAAVVNNPFLQQIARERGWTPAQLQQAASLILQRIAEQSAQTGQPVRNIDLLNPEWMTNAVSRALAGSSSPAKPPAAPVSVPRGGGGGGGYGGYGGYGGPATPPAPAPTPAAPVAPTPPSEPNVRPAQPTPEGVLFLDDAVFQHVPPRAIQVLQQLLQSLGFQATGVFGRYLPTEWRGPASPISLSEDQLAQLAGGTDVMPWVRWLAWRLGWFGATSAWPGVPVPPTTPTVTA